jgi:plastocyanin
MAARRRRVLAALTLAVAMTMGPAGTADAVTVGVRGVFHGSRYVWSPAVKGITRGVTVRWRSVNGSHVVKSRGTNWSYFRNVPAGTSVTRTFNLRGTFRYYCTIHGSVVNGVCTGMCGKIVVS